MHPRLLSDLADLERADAQRAAADRRRRRDTRRAARRELQAGRPRSPRSRRRGVPDGSDGQAPGNRRPPR